MLITKERLDRVLSYDRETGIFTWQVARGRAPAGAVAGTPEMGYVLIRVDGVQYCAHRLAWLTATGSWPTFEIDHIDGCRSNNSISNLRDAPRAINQQNQKRAQVTNSCRLLGVSKSDARGRFRARIFVDGKEQHLGSFSTAEKAHEAYLEAKRKLHKGCTI